MTVPVLCRSPRPRAGASRARGRPWTLGLISPCGWGNLGDAAIQQAVIDAARSLDERVRVLAFTLNPADTEARHGIESHPISGIPVRGYAIAESRATAPSGGVSSDTRRRVGRWARRVPWVSSLHGFLRFRVGRELAHIRDAWRWSRDIDLLVVSGGGQLDDYWGQAWAHPYALAKWAVIARLTGTDYRMLSVGVGSMQTRLSRCLLLTAVRLASSVSYRDAGSRDLMLQRSRRADGPVVPDLAFGLRPSRRPGTGPARDRRTIGLSPMSWRDPRFWPEASARLYEDYLERLARFIEQAHEQGYAVVLFATTGSDRHAIRDLVRRLKDAPSGALEESSTSGLSEYFETLARVEAVVASRLHGLILAHLCGRPGIAISYDRKVRAHMGEMGQDAYCLEIESFTPAALWEALSRLTRNREAELHAIGQWINAHRERVDAQFRLVFEGCRRRWSERI